MVDDDVDASFYEGEQDTEKYIIINNGQWW